ncbi:hypothetical protein JD844_011076 [Phrynosoma platyrhinos]|uniref:Aquaporin 6 n=1 Tax=Phrynosoma platyrhinos TaxID=52577 RepID=A0ABQ7THS7_PHRPL|nr:hypothetical protein JD844_011076 [Phrynosoma platyrhinos]
MWRELLSGAFYRAVFTELLVTSIYVFFGLGSVLSWPERPSVLQSAITFNLVAATTVQISWRVSGAHVNPSVTVAFLLGSRISLRYFTSCSMNPARSFGPAVIVGRFPQHWVFWVGPLAGAILASLLYNFVLYHDPKTLAQRLAILKGSYDGEELEKERDQPKETISLPSLVHRL